jgi:DNA-binding beta-propeller fold protein YncE
LRKLRGKVVLLDFWTYGCINCLHIIPDVQRLEAAYPRELVVIGVHSGKYDNERLVDNIRQATRRYGISHAVVNDRDFRIWNAYRVPGWPTQIVIDPAGRHLMAFVGENHYGRIDQLVKATIDLHRKQGTLREGALYLRAESAATDTSPLLYPGKVLANTDASRLFIADTNHHRLVVTDPQGTLREVIGNGVAGANDGPFATATFRQPQGMALHEDMLYVADTGNHLLRRIDLRRRMVETIAGSGAKARMFNVPGLGRGIPLNSPWDLHRHGQHLYIAMAGMHQVWRMDLATARLEPFSGSGREDLVDAVHSEAAMGQPSGLSGDAHQLYVADSEVNAVRAARLHPFGRIVTLAGGGLFTFGDRDGLGAEARLQHPLGVAYAGGTVYVADTYNHKIKALDPRTGRLQTFAGTGTPGDRDGPGDQAQFYEPGGLSVGGGQLYVADTNNQRIRVLDLTSRLVSTLSIRGLTPPTAAITSAAAASPDAVVKLAEQAMPAASQGALRIALDIPSGFKLSPGAPATLAVSVQGDGVRVPPEHGVQTLMPFDPNLVVPLYIGPPGERALLQVDLAFVICRRNDQGICALRQVVWQAPVRSQSGAAPSALTLRYRVRPF